MRVANNKLLLDDQSNEKPPTTIHNLDLYLFRGVGQIQIQEEEKLNPFFLPGEGKEKRSWARKVCKLRNLGPKMEIGS